MKNLTICLTLMGLLIAIPAFTANTTYPSCANSNALEAQIDNFEAQGYEETGRQYFQILYFAPPTPPYIDGTLQVSFYPTNCPPNQICPVTTLAIDVWVTNSNGNCVYRF